MEINAGTHDHIIFPNNYPGMADGSAMIERQLQLEFKKGGIENKPMQKNFQKCGVNFVDMNYKSNQIRQSENEAYFLSLKLQEDRIQP